MIERLRETFRRMRDAWNRRGNGRKRSDAITAATVIIVVAAVAAIAWAGFRSASSDGNPAEVPTDVGMSVLGDGKGHHVRQVTLDDARQQVTVTFQKGHGYRYRGEDHDSIVFMTSLGQSQELAKTLERGDYADGYKVVRKASKSSYIGYIIDFIILGVLVAMCIPMLGSLKGASKTSGRDVGGVTFDSVKGEDTAVSEMAEIKDMMIRPGKYMDAGARMPKGVLLYGEPGTGKTLLARALAGETNSSFYAANGAQFVEMFVGLGARRIRKLFKAARDNAPSIIFLDEIDAIGGTRGRDSNSEREQTLNQLLVELDGFEQNGDVLVVAATNRPDFLDKALLRPGRFDRQIEVDMPDVEGREAILRVHADGKTLGDDADLKAIASQTAGMSGAQLANVMNEAALMAVRDGDGVIRQADLSEGVDRVLSGPRKDARGDYVKDMRRTAYHEGGHAVVAMSLKDADPVTKITVLPRGRALGYTVIGPDEDATGYTKSQIFARLAYMMGGRAAEEEEYGQPSTGAADDLGKATALARDCITKYGFGRHVACWDGDDGDVSDGTRAEIEKETSLLLDSALKVAREAVRRNFDVLERLAELLMSKETLGADDIGPLAKDIAAVEWDGDCER